MRLRTRVWSLGKLFVLAGALAATFLVFFGLSMRAALRTREVRVPALVGRPVNEATRMLAELDLPMRIDENRRADPKVPSGQVMQQDPPAGIPARRGRTVRVWVSSGPRSTPVPALVGQTERTARIRLEQDGLELASVSEVRSPDYPAGSVVAQEPPPGSRAPQVRLLLNRGEEATTYVMPDVIGMDGERVATVLRNRGLRVSIVGSQPYPGVPPGTVVRQQPAGGYQVAPGTPISIEVSR
jgi:eukaryotic-like serine/threonine-protein kinase